MFIVSSTEREFLCEQRITQTGLLAICMRRELLWSETKTRVTVVSYKDTVHVCNILYPTGWPLVTLI